MTIDISSALGQPIVDKRVDILRRIGQLGSISKAAKAADVSYKAAWQAIDTLTALAGAPLVTKVVGGADGGGAELTDEGREILKAAAALQSARIKVLSELQGLNSVRQVALTSAAFRLSARNIVPGVITEVHGGSSQVKVSVEICIGNTLKASVTTESAQLLDLVVGKEVLAIFKATAAQVFDHYPENPGKFLVSGTVVTIPQKRKGGEVTLRLSNGIKVIGFVKSPHNLEEGKQGYFTIAENNIIIGLPA